METPKKKKQRLCYLAAARRTEETSANHDHGNLQRGKVNKEKLGRRLFFEDDNGRRLSAVGRSDMDQEKKIPGLLDKAKRSVQKFGIECKSIHDGKEQKKKVMPGKSEAEVEVETTEEKARAKGKARVKRIIRNDVKKKSEEVTRKKWEALKAVMADVKQRSSLAEMYEFKMEEKNNDGGKEILPDKAQHCERDEKEEVGKESENKEDSDTEDSDIDDSEYIDEEEEMSDEDQEEVDIDDSEYVDEEEETSDEEQEEADQQLQNTDDSYVTDSRWEEEVSCGRHKDRNHEISMVVSTAEEKEEGIMGETNEAKQQKSIDEYFDGITDEEIMAIDLDALTTGISNKNFSCFSPVSVQNNVSARIVTPEKNSTENCLRGSNVQRVTHAKIANPYAKNRSIVVRNILEEDDRKMPAAGKRNDLPIPDGFQKLRSRMNKTKAFLLQNKGIPSNRVMDELWHVRDLAINLGILEATHSNKKPEQKHRLVAQLFENIQNSIDQKEVHRFAALFDHLMFMLILEYPTIHRNYRK